jgi:hypothetical protein
MLISRHAADNLKRALEKYKTAAGTPLGVVSASTEEQGVENTGSVKAFGLQLQGLGRLFAWCVSNPYVIIASALIAKHLNNNQSNIDGNSAHDKAKGKRKLPSRDDQRLHPGPVVKFQHFVGAAAAFVSALKPPMPVRVVGLPGK